MSEYLEEVHEFVAQHAGGQRFADDEDMFAAGRINSLFAVQLVMWVERTYGIAVQGEDLDIANFRTVADVARFVETRLGTDAAVAS
ncbi:acyl carrier protein [Streptomyces sp. NPDC019396]|uniref:acyl carrier protein n=1 Tax=Streptomyces sp. NPDC019396 TaxID=3154687 RepID=UPI0033E08087